MASAQDYSALHRALVCGKGFCDWMAATSMKLDKSLRPLPVSNFLDFGNDKLADAIVDEALPKDRVRFRGYLSKRPLGLGLITGVSIVFRPFM